MDYADVLASTSEGGIVRCNLGDVRTGVGIAQECPVLGMGGFVYRPADPTPDGCAVAQYDVYSNELVISAISDPRFASKVGQMQPGDCGIVSEGEGRIIVKAATDTVVLLTTNNGNTMQIQVNGQDNAIVIQSNGAIISLTQDGPGNSEITLAAGGSMLRIGKDGVFVDGPKFIANCGSGHLGLLTPIGPVPATNLCLGPMGGTGIAVNWTAALT